MDAAILVHIKEGKTYEEWEEIMLNAYDNRKEVEDGKIVYGKANDNTAIILRFDFDPEEMAKRLEDLEFMERVSEVVESREMFSISPIQRPLPSCCEEIDSQPGAVSAISKKTKGAYRSGPSGLYYPLLGGSENQRRPSSGMLLA